jgi:hypothetical protein
MTAGPGTIYLCAPVNALSRASTSPGLPMSLDYLTWDFRRDTGVDLEQAEK